MSEAARLGLGGSRRMRRRVLCGCWARLAFLRAREGKKGISSSSRQNRAGLQKNTSPPCLPIDGWSPPSMETTPGKHGRCRRRAGERAMRGCQRMLLVTAASFPGRHLLFDPVTGKPTHLTNGVCLNSNYSLCNGNPWPGYFDYSLTSVAPLAQ